MKITLMIVLACCLPTLFCVAEQSASLGGVVPTYELYSWQTPKGDWNFTLLYTTNRQKTIAEVFDKKSALHGLDQLKRRISKLPVRANVVWLDRLTLGGVRIKGSERLKYPPEEITEEVRRYAEERQIALSGPEHRYP